ncbi:MAG: hypothetical protein IKO49_04935 [Bacilli bacterium]|nr:hypothetical protein [Bacilli bacterium]
MKYEEYEKLVFERFSNSILTDNASLKEKLVNYLMFWYNNILKEDVQRIFATNNYEDLIPITYKIDYLCQLTDLDKIKYIYKDDNIDKLYQCSNEIYQLCIKHINDDFTINKEEYDKYLLKLTDVSKDINVIYKSQVDEEISECILDLNYLSGKHNTTSVRLREYINKYKNVKM